jgi:hypothetical protein
MGFTVPWEMAPHQLAEALQPPGGGAILVGANGTAFRRGTSERAERNSTGLRRGYEEYLAGSRPRAPYAEGGTRATPSRTQHRRAALAQVLREFPEATPAQIMNTYRRPPSRSGGQPINPGGCLWKLLDGAQPCPSKSPLASDLKILRSQDPGGRSKAT